jgi:ATP-dependent DNA ligase
MPRPPRSSPARAPGFPGGLDPDVLRPMEALEQDAVPAGDDWSYEPKWDGFRCLAFRDGEVVDLRSKTGKPLGRYFPDAVEAVRAMRAQRFVLDGELVIPIGGRNSFDELLLRIHPAPTRVQKLAAEHPATLVVFDLLGEDDESLVALPSAERRPRLERFAKKAFARVRGVALSPATTSLAEAKRWLAGAGTALDGVVAKRRSDPYRAGARAMVKVKRRRTADCVVGGFRLTEGTARIGSVLLGLYDDEGLLHHVGVASSIPEPQRAALERDLVSLAGGSGFTGRAPGGPSRWTQAGRAYESVEPRVVLEVEYDHVTAERFRHGTRFLRRRPDKDPRACTLDQIAVGRARGPRVTRPAAPAARGTESRKAATPARRSSRAASRGSASAKGGSSARPPRA